MHVAGAGLRNDFGTAVADAAEFRAERIATDADFLNLILGRNAASGESVDYECGIGAGTAARTRDLLQVLRKFIFIVGQRIDEIFAQHGCLKAGVRIDADFGACFRDFDVLRNLSKRHRNGQRSQVGRDFHHFRIGVEVGGCDLEFVVAWIGWYFEFAAAAAGSLVDNPVTLVQLDLDAGHHRPARIHHPSSHFSGLSKDYCCGQQ